jgi:peroxiredoxin
VACRWQMAQLRRDFEWLDARGIEVVVVSPETPEAFESYWRQEQFAFIGLPDPHEEVLQLFSSGSDESAPFAATPDWVLIDKSGRVRRTHYRSWATGSMHEDLTETLADLDRSP